MYGEQVASALSTSRTAGTPNFSVDLTWTADANAKAYMIFRKEDSGDPQLIELREEREAAGDRTEAPRPSPACRSGPAMRRLAARPLSSC